MNNSQLLFRRSRRRLACWYAIAMGGLLSLSGLGMYRALVRSNWIAIEREIESIAGTLHDSFEPMLPANERPTVLLQQIFPDLCVVEQPCNNSPTLIQRHTTGISDRTTYYIRLFNQQGELLAFSPNQPLSLPTDFNPTPWQTFGDKGGSRYHQFTTILHSAHNGDNQASNQRSWGYLQIGRTLATYDAELSRIQWILAFGLPLMSALIAVTAWALSGLAMRPIYQSYQQQQQFTANAAHELRSPLASLLATVEATLRLSSTQPQVVAPMLETVERQGRRLSHLIADLLLLSRLEQDASPKPDKPCCLNDVVADLTEEFSELANVSKVDLTSQVPDAEIYVAGDESQLYRLVSNVIANAIQYTPAHGSVRISLKTRDHMTLVSVEDSGIGIPLSEQSQIFERFYRVNSDRSRKTGGTGLGLAISQAIAHHHDGKISVHSNIGQGSLFTIHLPSKTF
ncbi:MAG: two-component sensor histidine kinase [Phormidesmis priestleyi]|uniref:histidine kinase n=1 Tax=Phormidesmis priestleyi TaxID=268141 RepID=A0A2W4XCT2_9CYAN|nr:MAG: two-component sensor histidine kinase [Phormidesmis priestleyi]